MTLHVPTMPAEVQETTSFRWKRLMTGSAVSIVSDILRLVDAVLIVAVGLQVFVWSQPDGQPLALLDHRPALVAITIIVPLLLMHAGFTADLEMRHPASIVRRMVMAVALIVGGFIGGDLLMGISWLNAAPFVFEWAVVSGGLILLARTLTEAMLGRLNRMGAIRDRIAIVGAGETTDELISRVRSGSAIAVDIAGIFDDRSPARFAPSVTPPTGTLDDLLNVARQRDIDHVVVTFPASADARLIQVIRKLKALAVNVSLCPDRIAFVMPSQNVSFIADVPLLQVVNRPIQRWQRVFKDAEDIILGSLLLLLLSPLLFAVAIAIRLTSPGPALFWQKRHGFNNTEFWVAKFRTMRKETSDHAGRQQTKRGDSRITPIGAVLRRTSIDELPQLLNVVRGEMSLVGPRPHPIGMRTQDLLSHEIVEDYAHRHRVRPGITGWAQINGFRGATEEPYQLLRRVELDLFYIENWSVMFDLKILFLTVFRVASDPNAF